jgi:hypothetical protein
MSIWQRWRKPKCCFFSRKRLFIPSLQNQLQTLLDEC